MSSITLIYPTHQLLQIGKESVQSLYYKEEKTKIAALKMQALRVSNLKLKSKRLVRKTQSLCQAKSAVHKTLLFAPVSTKCYDQLWNKNMESFFVIKRNVVSNKYHALINSTPSFLTAIYNKCQKECFINYFRNNCCIFRTW